MEMLKQIFAVTRMGLSTIPGRLGASLVVVIGMACAVGALVSVLSMSTGFMRAVTSNARTDRAVVLSEGAQFEGPLLHVAVGIFYVHGEVGMRVDPLDFGNRP